MANTNDSPNGHDNDEDLPEVLKLIDTFDKRPPEKQRRLIQRLRDLAAEYKDSPELSAAFRQVADDFERRISKLPTTNTDQEKQV